MPVEIHLTTEEVLESLKDQRGSILASYGAETPDTVAPDEYQDYIKDTDILTDLEALDIAIRMIGEMMTGAFNALLVELVKERIRYRDKHGFIYSKPDSPQKTGIEAEHHFRLAGQAHTAQNAHQARWQLFKAAERILAMIQAIDEAYPPARHD